MGPVYYARKPMTRLSILLTFALAFAGCGARPPLPSDWNVVVILIDTLRADHLPFYGYPVATAPYLSELAERGTVFRRAHSSSSWTAPATASLFTSLHPFQHGVMTGMAASRSLKIELNRIPEELLTLGELFRDQGFRTFAVTDNLNICEAEGFDQGFDFFQNYHFSTAPALNAKVLEWESELRAAERYFLYLHYVDPHIPYRPREPWYVAGETEQQDTLNRYDSEIRFTDEYIRALGERLGWHERTLVVVLSDHGEEFGEHGGTKHGRTLYREVLDIPLLFYAPGLLPGEQTVMARVSIIDVLPTLAELIGAAPSPQFEGESLLPLLGGDPGAVRTLYADLYRRRKSVVGESGPLLLQSVIRGDLKLITSNSGPDLLFDLEIDPWEQDDRRDVDRDEATALRDLMDTLRAEASSYASEGFEVTLTPAERERLRSLGYVD